MGEPAQRKAVSGPFKGVCFDWKTLYIFNQLNKRMMCIILIFISGEAEAAIRSHNTWADAKSFKY